MYIKKIEIKNIKSIRHLKMHFDQPNGWHVIIGDNGSGKSTLLRSITVPFFGPHQLGALRHNFDTWINTKHKKASIKLEIGQDEQFDRPLINEGSQIFIESNFIKEFENSKKRTVSMNNGEKSIGPLQGGYGAPESTWFIAAYGPLRRFIGGKKKQENLNNPRLNAIFHIFDEDGSLPATLEWLQNLHYEKLYAEELNKGGPTSTFDLVKSFINEGKLLPHGVVLDEVSPEGAYFRDGDGKSVHILDLSDGHKSVLSFILDLLRQFFSVYDGQEIFDKSVDSNNNIYLFVRLPGVVLIDEIDIHLHPSWQTQIGKWFLKYFPAVQFIVTTHSPLICQTSKEGSIWRLATPGSSHSSGQVTGQEYNKLIYGNVLDAFGTEMFGESVTRSQDAKSQLNRLARLNNKALHVKLTPEENAERRELKILFASDSGVLE